MVPLTLGLGLLFDRLLRNVQIALQEVGQLRSSIAQQLAATSLHGLLGSIRRPLHVIGVVFLLLGRGFDFGLVSWLVVAAVAVIVAVLALVLLSAALCLSLGGFVLFLVSI